MKRFNLFFTAVCVLLLECFSSSALAKKNTVVELFSWRPAEKRVWDAVNKANLLPGITVNARATVLEYYADLTLLNLQNKKADVFLWQPGASRLNALIERGFIEPNENDLSMMNQSALTGALGPDGKYYGVPFAVQFQSLMVNGLEAKKAGITRIPQTLSELESAFDQMLKAGKIPLYMPLKDDWYVSQLIGEVFTAGIVPEQIALALTTGEACFTDASYIEIFNIVNKWLKAGYISDKAADSGYYDMYKAVAFGNAITSLEGAWMTGKQEVYYVMNPNYEFQFWPIPGASGKYSAFGDGTYQVAANSYKKEAALKVLALTTTQEFSQIFTQYAQQLPAYEGDLNIPPSDLSTMSSLISQKAYPVSLFNTYALNKDVPTYQTLFKEAIRQLIANKLTPIEAGQHIQKGLNGWGYIGSQKCVL